MSSTPINDVWTSVVEDGEREELMIFTIQLKRVLYKFFARLSLAVMDYNNTKE